jgi:hypothetical protein
MKTENGDTIIHEWVKYPQPNTVSITVESVDWSKATALLTPIEARQLAAILNEQADELMGWLEEERGTAASALDRLMNGEGA